MQLLIIIVRIFELLIEEADMKRIKTETILICSTEFESLDAWFDVCHVMIEFGTDIQAFCQIESPDQLLILAFLFQMMSLVRYVLILIVLLPLLLIFRNHRCESPVLIGISFELLNE
jgi:hypothetical protein